MRSTTRDRWFEVGSEVDQHLGHPCRTVGPTESAVLGFRIPPNFTVVLVAEVVAIVGVGADADAIDIDATLVAGAIGEACDVHTAADTTTVYDWTGKAGALVRLDVTELCGDLAPGDYVGITLAHNTLPGSVHYLGIRVCFDTF